MFARRSSPLGSEAAEAVGSLDAVQRRWAACAVFLATWGLFLGYYQVKFGLDHPPSATGDEPDYDSLGWELAKGNGFQLDTGDPEFRRPYDLAARESSLYRLSAPRSGPITARPPLFPVVIAGTDLLFGRQFWAVRSVNAGAMAAVAGLLVLVLLRHRGLWFAVAAAILFVAVDTRSRLYGRTILTEPLAALLVALMCCVADGLPRRRWWTAAALWGLLLGLLVLTRTVFILWLPGIALLAALRRRQHSPEPGNVPSLLNAAVLIAVFGAVIAPWGVRNCLLLGRIMPFGAQGATQAAAAFGDAVWQSGGLWRNIEDQGFYDGHLVEGMSPLERELAMADISRPRSRQWVRENPGKVIALFPMKIYQEVRPRSWTESLLLGLAVIGVPFAWSIPEARIGGILWLLNLCAIGVTWSVEGRFLVPMLFVQHLYAACGALGPVFGICAVWKRLCVSDRVQT